MRIPSIDLFRGLAIALMVFFTISYWTSANLPEFLKHNEADSLHIGDFVLPMFLFASGMSLVFFHEKRKGKKGYWLDAIERFGKLVIISAILSIFSAGAFLGMDEVMLSALLFLASLLLLQLPEAYLVSVSLAIPTAYALITAYTGLLPGFGSAYLGGYPAAIFYLPVMLTGVMVGRRVESGEETGWIRHRCDDRVSRICLHRPAVQGYREPVFHGRFDRVIVFRVPGSEGIQERLS